MRVVDVRTVMFTRTVTEDDFDLVALSTSEDRHWAYLVYTLARAYSELFLRSQGISDRSTTRLARTISDVTDVAIETSISEINDGVLSGRPPS